MSSSSTHATDHAELDFLEYRRSGDPAALARVFDQVAPELLLLAAHLTGGGRERADEAEDLLQSTFVAAIESAPRYDASRPLRAWLVGILVHMAQRERRRRRRVPDPERLEQIDVIDPEQLAVDAEFAERFQRALAALPQPYRNVLTLRLVHGLRPVAIAHAHGVPPVTVRSQLRRGLEILRQALPAGFGVASLLVVARAQGLATVRAAVLAHAEEIAAGVAVKGVATAGGAAAWLGTRAGVAVVLLIAGVATWLLAAGGWGADPAGKRSPVSAVAPPVDPGAAVPEAPAGAAGAGRSEQEAPASAGPAALLVVIQHAPDGAPAAGVSVLVTADEVPDPTLTEQRLVTDARGEARVAALAPGNYFVQPDRGEIEYLTVPPHSLVTHRVELPAGVDVQGKVVDPDGQPVAGAAVLIADSEFLDEGQEAATTDAGGLFALRGVPPGRSLSAITPGWRPSVLRRLRDTPGPERVRLRVDEPGVVVRGRVSDALGAPLAGVPVLLGRVYGNYESQDPNGPRRRPPIWLRTGTDGRFETSSASFQDGVLPVWVRAPGCQVWTTTLYAGDVPAELKVELQPGAQVRGVVRSGDGGSVRGTMVRMLEPRAYVQSQEIAPSWATPRCRVDAQGAYVLLGVAEGSVDVLANHPERDAWGRVTTRRGQAVQLDLVLGPPPRIHGRVADAQGTALAGFLVCAVPLPGLPRPAEAITDASGRFSVTPCLPTPYSLEVWEPGSAWCRAAQCWFEVVPGEDPRVLEIAAHRRASVFVRGRLLDEHGDPARASMVLALSGAHGMVARTDPETGRYVLGPVPPGSYAVLAKRGEDLLAVSGPVRLAAGATHEFEPERLVRPGRVLLRVSAEPGAPAAGQVEVCTAAGFALGTWLVGGDKVPLVLPPGPYIIVLSGAWPRRMLRVLVHGGEDAEVVLRPERGASQKVRVLDAVTPLQVDLTALADVETAQLLQTVVVEAKSEPPRLIPFLPRGQWRLTVTDVRGRTATATVSVEDPAQPLPEIELRLR